MKATDKNFYEEISKQVKPLLNDLKNGKSARDIAAAIYMTLPDKTEDTAGAMADRVIGAVDRYHDSLENCFYMNDDGSYKCKDREGIRNFIKSSLKDNVKDLKNPIDRSKIYYRNLIALRAYGIYMEGGDDAEQKAKDYVDAHKNFPYNDDTAVQMEERLFDLNVEAIENTDIIAAQLPAILAAMQDANFDQAMGIYAFGRESADIKVVLSMQAYVNSVNGMYEDIDADADIDIDADADIDIDAVTTATCAAVDTYSAIGQEEAGLTTKETLMLTLQIIGCVVAVILAAYLTFIAMRYLFFFLYLFVMPFQPLLSLILSLVATTAITVGVLDSDLFDMAGVFGTKVGKAFFNVINFTGKKLKAGIDKAIDFAKEKGITQKIVEFFNKAKELAGLEWLLIKSFFTGNTDNKEADKQPDEGNKAQTQTQAQTETSAETLEIQNPEAALN